MFIKQILNHIFLFFIIISFETYAVEVEVLQPCSDETLVKSYYEVDSPQSLGDVTINFLSSFKIPFQGTASGINSIQDTPVGLEAMEVINDNEMNAYGWCFSINGVAPELMPDQVDVYKNDKVVWWYGYAKYKNGEWITQCTPSSTRASGSFCKNI